MMTRIVLLESQLAELRRILFDIDGVEGAAFILCGESRSARAIKLIGHAVVPIKDEDFVRRERDGLSITSSALTRIAKLAKYENLSVIFAHSHPEGFADFSTQDDREEEKLMPFLCARVPGRVHGTLVLTAQGIKGRLYTPSRTTAENILIVGQRISSSPSTIGGNEVSYFDRQVRAFGQGTQQLLAGLHVGIVGLGGTGSPVAEQLCRLGVGHISLFDGDQLDETNVNRVYGSRVADAGRNKVDIAKEHLESIGLGTLVDAFDQHITQEASARALRDCDLVFGCTDKELPRAILLQLALRYTIPVFDLGVLISSDEGRITSVFGRVTTFFAGEACLFCRGRISAEVIRVETLSENERQSQVREGYAPELDTPAPAVIAFTSATASAAVAEFLHRLTGFMGNERFSTEVLLAFDQNRVRTNRIQPREGCTCGDQSFWGRGDIAPYLDMVWANRTS